MDSRWTPGGLLMHSRWTPDAISGVYLDSWWSPSGCVAQCNYLPHPFNLVKEAINSEMSVPSAEFNTTTHKITPSYIKSWSFEGNVATVIGKQCPCLLKIIKIAAESNKSLKNSKKDTLVVSICWLEDDSLLTQTSGSNHPHHSAEQTTLQF
jgi:hypothetical protein